MTRDRSVQAHFRLSDIELRRRRSAVSAYLRKIPGLEPGAVVPATPTGDARPLEDEVLPDESAPSGQTRFKCTTRPYTMATNPDTIATMNPDVGKLWLGGLLQGDGYSGGLGSLKSLPITKRAPLKIFVNLLSENVTATVDNPDPASVQAAIGRLIARLERSDVAIPTAASFRQTTASSVEQGLLSLGFSARFLAAKAKGSLSIEHNASESSVIASLVQRYFTVSIVTPTVPAELFDLSRFKVADLDEQRIHGRLGSGNPPVIVSSITYGRTFLFSVTAKTTSDKLTAALSASVDMAHAGGSVDLSTEQKRILASSRIEVIANGGDEASFREAVKTQKWEAVLDRPSRLTASVPVSYQVDNLGDNSAAKFGETANYNLTECKSQGNRKVGELARISNLRLFSDRWDQSLHGYLNINGYTIFFQSRSGNLPVVREQQWPPTPMSTFLGFRSWPPFTMDNPSRYGVSPESLPQTGYYVASFSDPDEGKPGKLEIDGRLMAWNWIWGDPVNVFYAVDAAPFEYGEQSPAGGSVHAPLTLFYTVEKVADLSVP